MGGRCCICEYWFVSPIVRNNQSSHWGQRLKKRIQGFFLEVKRYIFWFLALVLIIFMFTNTAVVQIPEVVSLGSRENSFPPMVFRNKVISVLLWSFFMSCLLVIDKMVPSLQRPLKPDRRLHQHSVYKKRKSRRSYFSLGHEETKGKTKFTYG